MRFGAGALVLTILLPVASLVDAPATSALDAALTVEDAPTAGQAGGPTPTVRWTTGNGAPGEVVVTPADGEPRLFATGPSGSQEAEWILPDVHYRFELYQTAPRRRLLVTVEVGTPSAPAAVDVPALPQAEPTEGAANALLLVLAFAVVIGLVALAAAAVREARRAS